MSFPLIRRSFPIWKAKLLGLDIVAMAAESLAARITDSYSTDLQA